jgi:diguanylate cyclase (GGDEF)-like protein
VEKRRALDSTQRFAALGTWEIDVATGTIAGSAESGRIFGWCDTAARSHTTGELLARVHEIDRARLGDWLGRASSGGAPAAIEYRMECARTAERVLAGEALAPLASDDRRIHMHVDRVERRNGRPFRVRGFVHDGCERQAIEGAEVAPIDANCMAGLPNQQQFLERVARVIGNAQPPHDQVAVLCISLDLDQALKQHPGTRQHCFSTLVQRMKQCIRDRDTLCHLGTHDRDISLAHIEADKFTILLPGLLRTQDAYKVTKRIQESLAQPIEVDGAAITVHCSFGISIYPNDSLGPENLLKASESAMQVARAPGKSNIHFFTAAMNASAFERMTLETDLRTAIEREELLVYYQPKVEIATGNIVGVEALLRWKHPELGMVSPAQFIPIAEETGLIVPIGEYVLRVACAQNKRWQDQGLAPIRMAVNLSTVQFRDPDLHKMVTRVLQSTGLAAKHLELELTESVLLQKIDTTIATLKNLKKMGVHLSIDDFGTGYSSLSYLKRFPIDSLKIDQSFIREVTTNPEDVAITTSIILMGRSLKLKVVAEGVESPSQLALLRVLECDEAQGYLFSRPVPADEVVKLFSTSFAVAPTR